MVLFYCATVLFQTFCLEELFLHVTEINLAVIKKKEREKKKQHCDPGSHSLLVSNYQVEGLFFCEGMLFVMFSSKEN